jgi:alkylated DNA repair dioxygenase AlkB
LFRARGRDKKSVVPQRALCLEAPRVLLDDTERGCGVTYQPDFLAPAEADALFDELSTRAPWRAEAPVMFGRAIEVRRKACSFGEPGRRYRYSGLERQADPWPPAVAALLARLRAAAGSGFDYVLCNLYPDGDAGLGWHADDEADLTPGAPIASLSLGAERDFAMRLGPKGPACLTVALGHGSLLIMHGATQAHYQHRVPTRVRCRSPRVNLTFRQMAGTPA